MLPLPHWSGKISGKWASDIRTSIANIKSMTSTLSLDQIARGHKQHYFPHLSRSHANFGNFHDDSLTILISVFRRGCRISARPLSVSSHPLGIVLSESIVDQFGDASTDFIAQHSVQVGKLLSSRVVVCRTNCVYETL